VPFADDAGGVSSALQERRQGELIGIDDERSVARKDACTILAPSILARHDGVA